MQVKDFENASGFRGVHSQEWTSWKKLVTDECTQKEQQCDKHDRCMVCFEITIVIMVIKGF